ncbi:hypothetical protein HPB51_022395 [Rhipicephalus microplus]|uniref:Uncharacterized protein n=1 Tax=Rhipicephalus microplus TaxID=6941 RepID=A0A9J6DQB8_RHIMP|nr:hypothetical protein HPB51_022395 [Rhipicephalus microplus]
MRRRRADNGPAYDNDEMRRSSVAVATAAVIRRVASQPFSPLAAAFIHSRRSSVSGAGASPVVMPISDRNDIELLQRKCGRRDVSSRDPLHSGVKAAVARSLAPTVPLLTPLPTLDHRSITEASWLLAAEESRLRIVTASLLIARTSRCRSLWPKYGKRTVSPESVRYN